MIRLPLLEIFYNDKNLELKKRITGIIIALTENSISWKNWIDKKIIRLYPIITDNKLFNLYSYVIMNKKYCFYTEDLPKLLNHLFGTYLRNEIINYKANEMSNSIKNKSMSNLPFNMSGYNLDAINSDIIRDIQQKKQEQNQNQETRLYGSPIYADTKLNEIRKQQEAISSLMNPENNIIIPNAYNKTNYLQN